MTTFSFEKTGVVIPAPADMPGPGPYYTCLTDMRGVADFPADYAMYFTTDHVGCLGGVWLYLCDGVPTEPASWRSYDAAVADGAFDHLATKPAANPIFQETVQGDGHTETAHAQVIDGQVYMTYHKNNCGHNQSTLLGLSQDGVNFRRVNGEADSIVVDYDPATSVGDGHTGYFRWAPNPYTGIDAAYIAYSLHGGGDRYYSALWGSDDATAWHRIKIMAPIEGLATDYADRMIIWHELDPASIRPLGNGEYAALVCVGNRASGKVARISEIYEVFLAADGCSYTRPARRVLAIGGDDAPDHEELGSPTTMVIDGQLYMLYMGASQSGSVNAVMGAIGRFDVDAELPAPLPEADRSRHLIDPTQR